MPRDSGGVYSLPAGYLAVTGETIQASQHNPPLEDLSSAMTGSVPRSGAAPMTGPLKLTDGSETAPGLAFQTQSGTGLYKTATGFAGTVAGTKAFEVAAGGIVLSTLNVIGATSETALATNDTLPFYDLSATTNKRMLVSDFLKIINALTADDSPVASTDYLMTYDASDTAAKKVLLQNLPARSPRGYIDGCTLSNNASDATNDIDFAAGLCRDIHNTVDINVSAMTKRLDANWAPGTGAGMRASAHVLDDRTWHIFAVSKADGTQDFFAYPDDGVNHGDSTAFATAVLAVLQGETGGSAYLYIRRIASILRESGAIVPFTQTGDYFERVTPKNDIAATNPGTSAVTRTLSVPLRNTLFADVFFSAHQTATSQASYGLLSPLSSADSTPSVTMGQLSFAQPPGSSVMVGLVPCRIKTNTAGQIRSRLSTSDASTSMNITTRGWIDTRGRA